MLRDNKIIQKLIRYRYFGYLAVGGFIIFALFIANFGFVTDFEAVTSLTVTERSATIAKALPTILGLVLLSIIAIFFIVFELHLKMKIQGLASPLHKLAAVEKGIVNQLSVDSDRLKAEKEKQKELDKFEIPDFKPGEPIETHPTQSLVTQIISKGKKEEEKVNKKEKKKAEEHDDEDKEEEPKEKLMKKAEKKKVHKSWFKSKLSAFEKKREERLKSKQAVKKQKLEELKKKREELLKHKKHIEKAKIVPKVVQVDSKEKLKQKLLLEKQKKKEEKERLKKARSVMKQKAKEEKERKYKLEQMKKDRQRQAEEKRKLLEQKKLEQAKKRQKHKEKKRNESFYRNLESEFNSIDKELDDLIKRSRKRK